MESGMWLVTTYISLRQGGGGEENPFEKKHWKYCPRTVYYSRKCDPWKAAESVCKSFQNRVLAFAILVCLGCWCPNYIPRKLLEVLIPLLLLLYFSVECGHLELVSRFSTLALKCTNALVKRKKGNWHWTSTLHSASMDSKVRAFSLKWSKNICIFTICLTSVKPWPVPVHIFHLNSTQVPWFASVILTGS